MSNPKVYIPQLTQYQLRDSNKKVRRDADGRPIMGSFNVTPASVYGEILEPIFEPFSIVPGGRGYEAIARTAMKDYDPHQDSIIAIGDPLALAIVTSVVALEHRKYSLLRWDGRTHEYVKMTFNFNF